MADKTVADLIKEIERAEIEYNVLILEATAKRITTDAKILNKRKFILEKKVEYLKECLANNVEPELDLQIAGPDSPAMWGPSSD